MTLVRLKPAAPRSRVKHSTTEQLRSMVMSICLVHERLSAMVTPKYFAAETLSNSTLCRMYLLFKVLPNIYVSWSTSELRVRLAPLNRFKPSSKIFYWPFQGGTSFVDPLCFCSVLCWLCLCVRLFICALWSPAGKGLTSWFSFVVSTWVCHFPIGILGQVCYLIVSIPDLCTLNYFLWFEGSGI